MQHIQNLIQQKKYRQALGELNKLRQQGVEVSSMEAEILLEQGKNEASQQHYRQAIQLFQRSLAAGEAQGVYYELAKAYLCQGDKSSALKTIEDAFEAQKLTKPEGGCYFKLLFIAGKWEQAKEILKTCAKRFSTQQLDWAKGVICLHEEKLEEALAYFKKVKQDPTPEDNALVWQLYTQQQLGQWSETAPHILVPLAETKLPRIVHSRLILRQFWEGSNHKNIFAFFKDVPKPVEIILIQLFRHLEQHNYHEAANMLLLWDKVENHFYRKCPEIEGIRRSLLLRGGQQAMDERETESACRIWQPLIQSKTEFDPQLVYNYSMVLEAEDREDERAKVLKQLQNWIQKEAKQHPDRWPDPFFRSTLAHLHCLLADALVAQNKISSAFHSVAQGARIDPDSPEVWLRQGFIAIEDEEDSEKAISLFTKALEAGAKSERAYIFLKRLLEKDQQLDELKRIKTQFGQVYGDIDPLQTPEIPDWIRLGRGENLREVRRQVIQREKALQKTPLGMDILRIYETFIRSIEEEENPYKKRPQVDLEYLKDQWGEILETIVPDHKIKALQLMLVYLTKFVTRQKGFAKVFNHYLEQLENLGQENAEARFGYIAMLALKDVAKSTLEKTLKPYLNQTTQPHQTLAELQLHVRYFMTSQALRPAIEKALSQDSQNPLLLLAKATTYASDSDEYETLKKQSFEIARRLQDQRALERLREEEELTDKSPFSVQFGRRSSDSFLDFVIEQLLDRFTEEELEGLSLSDILNEVKANLYSEEDEEEDDDDEDDSDFPSINLSRKNPADEPRSNRGSSGSKSRSKSKKRASGFG